MCICWWMYCVQILQFICSCSLLEGLLKFFLCIFNTPFANLYNISKIWFFIFSRTFIPTQHVPALRHSFFLSVPNFECPYLNLLLWSANHTRNWTSTLYWTFLHSSTASVKTYIRLLTSRVGLFLEKFLSFSANSRLLWNQTLYQSLHIRLSLPPRIIVSHMNPAHIFKPQSLKSY